jgi:ubiquinone/menaquinone biosynthesis C-methylase UbiE
MSSWQDAETVRRFLDGRRAAIPYAADQIRLLLHLARHFVGAPRRVLDLGCGDGVLARAVLAEHPAAHAVLLDHSEPMLQRAEAAMADYADRCSIRRAELAEPLAVEPPFDLAVSGFAVHHLPDARKRSLYAEVHGLLAPGGLFVNIEHVASASPRVEQLFDALYIDAVAEKTGKPRPEVEAQYHGRADKADNVLAPVDEQVGWLRQIGFLHADCYFKWLELAAFGGVKA